MKGKTTIQGKHADCFTSDTPVLPASFLPVFPFTKTIYSRLSAIFHESNPGVCAASKIKSANETVFSATHMTFDETLTIFFVTENIVVETEMIVSGSATFMSGSGKIVFVSEKIFSGTKKIFSDTLPDSRNQRVASGA